MWNGPQDFLMKQNFLKPFLRFRLVEDETKKVYGDSPKFGVNLAVDTTGEVKIGDPVYVQYH